jgi:molybdopterin converting factor small subunit
MTNNGTIHIRLLLFAAHREMVGRSQLDLDVARGATPEDVYRLLEAAQPSLAALRPYTSFAVNREMAEASTRLQSGDEVAFLQPVSGG